MKLNGKYRIVYDSNNTILQFYESREVLAKEASTGKQVGTGEYKEYTENYYCPNLKTALNLFLNKCTWGLETAQEIIAELNKVEKLIKELTKIK